MAFQDENNSEGVGGSIKCSWNLGDSWTGQYRAAAMKGDTVTVSVKDLTCDKWAIVADKLPTPVPAFKDSTYDQKKEATRLYLLHRMQQKLSTTALP